MMECLRIVKNGAARPGQKDFAVQRWLSKEV